MKKILFPRLLLMMLIFPLSLLIKAQNPTYLCELRNDAQTSSTVFEFDIYLLRTGSIPFEYAAAQFGILINPLIKNGGTITASIIAGSSDASLIATNQNPVTITFTDATNSIKIAGRVPPSPGLGAIISNVSPGIRVCRIRLTNTLPYAQFQPNLTWTTNTIYPTQIAAYVGGINTIITDYPSETTSNLANLVLNPAPTVNPTATPNTVCVGSSVQLNAGVTGGSGSFTYTWTSTPAGFSSTLANPTANPTANITYNVSVFDGVSTVNGSVSVTVNALPVATAGSPLTAICQGGTTSGLGGSVSGSATGGTWSTTAGGTFNPNATTLNATWTPPAGYSGTATLILTTSGGSCGNDTDSKTQVVNPKPLAAGTISGTASVCQGQSSVAYNVGPITNATSYIWAYSGTGATITGTTNSVTISFASNATSGNLTVQGNNTCGTGTISPNFAITVNSLPGAAGTISGSPTVCQGQATVSYSVPLITGATSYSWSYSGIGETITGTTNSVTISFAANATSGILTVLGVNACGNGVISANYPISINPLPSAAGAISGTASVCQGQSTVSYSTGVIVNATSYAWAYSGTGATITGTGNSVTISFASNATSGNLTVRGVNTCGNGVISANYPITVNPLPAAAGTITGTASVCQGQASVSYNVPVILNATSYTWVYSGTGATITGSSNSISITYASNATSGNLTVVGVNACGNGTVSANYPITVNSLPVAAGTISGTASVCQGQAAVGYSVPAIANATSHTWIYSGTGATITGSSNSITITFAANATSGNLTVQGTNACGNGTISANYPITVNPLPGAAGTITGTASVCQGQASVAYNVAAITNATSYGWAYSGTGATITGSTNSVTIAFAANATSGNLTVHGVNACGNGPVSANYPVSVNLLPVVPAQSTSATPGVSFLYTPTGGTIPAGTTYTWPVPALTGGVIGGAASIGSQTTINGTLNIPSGSGTAVYTVTPTSLAGCVGSNFTVTINVTSACVAVTVGTQPSNATACATSGIGTFTVVAAGTGPFTYQWQYFNGSTWGNVANGTPSAAVYTNAATASMSVTGISTPAVYQYHCVITNCSGGNTTTSNTATLTINAPPVPTLTSSDADNIFCFGTSVTFTAGGAGAGGTYDFRVNGATSQIGPTATYTTTSLGNAQVVTVVVTNSSLCSATSAGIANFVNQPPYITSGPTATCATDFVTYSVAVSVSNGTVTGSSGVAANTGGNNWIISGILAGVNVTLTLTDINGCITTQPVAAPNCLCPVLLPPVSGGDRSYCSGGVIPTLSATVVAGGNPKTVDWYASASGGSPLPGGSGSLTYTPSAAGTYYAVTREIVSNCVSSTRTPIILTMYPLPTPTLVSSDADNIFCSGTSITFTAGGGTTYDFRVGGVSMQNGVLTTFTTTTLTNGQAVNVIVTNANGCTATAGPITNTVNPSPIPTLTSSDADNSFCAGTSITFTSGGGATYDFRVGGISVQTGISTTYTTSTLTNGQVVTVLVSNANGCSTLSSAITNTVNPIPAPTLTSSDADNIFCAGTSITFTAGGGTNFNFRVGGVSVQNSTTNTYTTTLLTNGQVVDVIVGNSTGCALTSTGITNTVNPQPISNAGAGGDVCGLSFNLSAHPSIGIGIWTITTGTGTATFTPDASSPSTTVTVSEYGTYTFTWTEVSGSCTSSSAVTVNFYLQPVANAGTGGNNCGLGFRFNATLNAGIGTWTKVSGPGTVVFSPDANTANALVTVSAFGTYTFNWSVDNGTCSNSSSVSVVFIQQAAANAGLGGNSCDKTFTLSALVPATGTGTWTKTLGPGNATFATDNHKANAKVTVDQFGTYTFAWTVVNSTCSSSDVVHVVFHDLPSINAGRDTAFCKGGSVQLQAIGTGTVSWTPVALVNNPNIVNPIASPDATTTFTVNLTDQYGCKNSDNIIVEVRDKVVADAGPDQVLGYLFTATMDANLAHTYEKGLWSLIEGTGKYSDSTNAKTEVRALSLGKNKFLWTVTNGYCPVSRDTVMIEVNDFIIPTLITPNMDGKNDYFVLRGLATLGKTELIIFDRRGAMVYKNLNYDNSWNGVDYNKNPLPDDTYFYVIKSSNGKSISGYIVIRR